MHEASCRARWCAKESSNLSRYTTQAMQPRRQSLLSHGLSPYKKAKEQIFLREQAPDKIYSLLFCMACGFRKFLEFPQSTLKKVDDFN